MVKGGTERDGICDPTDTFQACLKWQQIAALEKIVFIFFVPQKQE